MWVDCDDARVANDIVHIPAVLVHGGESDTNVKMVLRVGQAREMGEVRTPTLEVTVALGTDGTVGILGVMLSLSQLRNEQLCLAIHIRLRGDVDRMPRTCVVEQYGIDFVDHDRFRLAVHPLLDLSAVHVVDMISHQLRDRDVTHILFIGSRMGPVKGCAVGARDLHSDRLVERAHPLRIARGEIGIRYNHHGAEAEQVIEKGAKGTHEGLPFPRVQLDRVAMAQGQCGQQLVGMQPNTKGFTHQDRTHRDGFIEYPLFVLASDQGHALPCDQPRPFAIRALRGRPG